MAPSTLNAASSALVQHCLSSKDLFVCRETLSCFAIWAWDLAVSELGKEGVGLGTDCGPIAIRAYLPGPSVTVTKTILGGREGD